MAEFFLSVGMICLSIAIVWATYEFRWFRSKQHELNGNVLGALGDLIKRVQALEEAKRWQTPER